VNSYFIDKRLLPQAEKVETHNLLEETLKQWLTENLVIVEDLSGWAPRIGLKFRGETCCFTYIDRP
jgi:hypothetical protein